MHSQDYNKIPQYQKLKIDGWDYGEPPKEHGLMNHLSLFSGYGGIDIAGEWAGMKTVAVCEREPYCQHILRKNFPEAVLFDDVKTLTKENLDEAKIPQIDIVTAGFPLIDSGFTM